MCSECEVKLDDYNQVILVFVNGVVYCEECLTKNKEPHVPESQKRKEKHQTLKHQRNKLGECVICNQPVVKGGEVCSLLHNSQNFLT